MVENTKIKNSPPQKLASDLTNRCFPILPKMDLKWKKASLPNCRTHQFETYLSLIIRPKYPMYLNDMVL